MTDGELYHEVKKHETQNQTTTALWPVFLGYSYAIFVINGAVKTLLRRNFKDSPGLQLNGYTKDL